MTRNFADAEPLPDWLAPQLPFRRRVYTGGDYKIHFIDEGEGVPVVLQHGNPMWCYLWRKVIRLLLDGPAPVRVIAPDLIGLGLSDKPRDPSVHTLPFHGEQISGLLQALELDPFVVVGQDWGGPIVAYAASLNAGRVRGAVFANTALAAPTKPPRVTMFHRFSGWPVLPEILFRGFNFPIPILHRVQGDPASLGPAEKRAYKWPLRKMRDRVAPLALARMVPTSLGHPSVEPMRRVDAWAREFPGPTELVWGMKDPILGKSVYRTRKLLPNAPVLETQAGHFLQEEVPSELAEAILRVMKT